MAAKYPRDGLGRGQGLVRNLAEKLDGLFARAAVDIIEDIGRRGHCPVDADPSGYRDIAMDGACGPWSTPATKAASRRLACAAFGKSPRVISQTICG